MFSYLYCLLRRLEFTLLPLKTSSCIVTKLELFWKPWKNIVFVRRVLNRREMSAGKLCSFRFHEKIARKINEIEFADRYV